MSGGSIALELVNVHKSFGALVALEDLSIAVRPGEIHGLIGPNGAGKTTAINLATGVFRLSKGAIRLAGRDVTTMSQPQRAAAGLARTFQSARPFGALPTITNLVIAIEQRRRCGGERASARAARQEAELILAAAGLEDSAMIPAGRLTYGQQKQLELLRALCFARTALLLDEPTAGLSLAEIERMLSLLQSNRKDLGILLIEHDMDVVMSTCDTITVIDAGRFLAHGTPDQVQADPAVVAAYLGE